MQLFYTSDISNGYAFFDSEESQHGIKVLRLRTGDSITFTDGYGNLYEGVISNADPKKMQAQIISSRIDSDIKPYHLHLAVSPLKNSDRLEWLIEKSVEIGVDEITPIICERSEKTNIRRERLMRIVVSAMKQSLKYSHPLLNQPEGFSTFVSRQHSYNKLIAHCNTEIKRVSISEAVKPKENYLILIGPEGDFTGPEIELAIEKGFNPIHMGTNRLRTETAGITACCSIYLSNL